MTNPQQSKTGSVSVGTERDMQGTFSGEVVLRGAYNYAQNNLSVTEGLEARVKSTYVKGL
jgi:hypothetical protein